MLDKVCVDGPTPDCLRYYFFNPSACQVLMAVFGLHGLHFEQHPPDSHHIELECQPQKGKTRILCVHTCYLLKPHYINANLLKQEERGLGCSPAFFSTAGRPAEFLVHM